MRPDPKDFERTYIKVLSNVVEGMRLDYIFE